MFGESNREKLTIDQLSLQQQEEALKETARAKRLFEMKSGATGFDSHTPTWGGSMRNSPEEQARRRAEMAAARSAPFGLGYDPKLGQSNEVLLDRANRDAAAEAAAEANHQRELERLAEEEQAMQKYHQEQMDRLQELWSHWDQGISSISRAFGIFVSGTNKDMNGLGDFWDHTIQQMHQTLMEVFVISPAEQLMDDFLRGTLEGLGVPTPESLEKQQRRQYETWQQGGGPPVQAGGGFNAGGWGNTIGSWVGGLFGGSGASIPGQFGGIGSGLHEGMMGGGGFGQMGGGLISTGISFLGSLFGLAEGGDIRREGMAMVGEHGPELLYLPQSARVQPLGPGRNAPGGGNSFTFNIDADDPIRVRRVVEGMMPEISAAANGSLVNKNQRGGNTAISKAF